MFSLGRSLSGFINQILVYILDIHNDHRHHSNLASQVNALQDVTILEIFGQFSPFRKSRLQGFPRVLCYCFCGMVNFGGSYSMTRNNALFWDLFIPSYSFPLSCHFPQFSVTTWYI